MKLFTLTLIASLACASAPALAGGPKAPPGWNKPPKAAPAPKKPGDLISGKVSFKHGGEPRSYTFVEGRIEKPGGDMFVLSVDFKEKADTDRNFLAAEGRFLRLMLAAQKPGKLHRMQISMLVAKDEKGNSQAKRKSQCELTLTKVGEKEFAGTGSCQSGLVDHEKKPARPVTELEFYVKAL